MMKICILSLILTTMKASAFVGDGSMRTSSRTQLLASSPRTEKDERKPWDLFRFVQQSSKFVQTPFQQKASKRTIKPGDFLWRPDSKDNDFAFAPLDDVVMGGASSSSFDNVSGIWRGKVTDANNGGFVGIRNTPYVNWDMTGCRGLELNVRKKGGSGRENRFKVGVRDSTEFNGVVWSSSVDVKVTPTKVRVPLDELKPTLFARVVNDQDDIQKDNIVGLQFVYSKFEYDGGLNPKFEIGDVDVQILEIRAY